MKVDKKEKDNWKRKKIKERKRENKEKVSIERKEEISWKRK